MEFQCTSKSKLNKFYNISSWNPVATNLAAGAICSVLRTQLCKTMNFTSEQCDVVGMKGENFTPLTK